MVRSALVAAALVLAPSCASPLAEGDALERDRAAALDEASLSLASLRPLVASLPGELKPLRRRVEEGEATEALQRALVGVVDRASALADDAERSLEPARAVRQPQGVLDRLEEEASAVATEARASAVQALDLAEVVSTRTGGIAEPAPPMVTELGGRGPTPELQQLLEGAAEAASNALARALAERRLRARSLVVVPVAVSLDGPARAGSAGVYGRLFSRRLVDALRKARLPAAFSSQCARDLAASPGDEPALVSGTLVLGGPDATFSLSVVDVRRRKDLAVVNGIFSPASPGW